MTLDVSAEIEIAASPADIAGIMFDPQREHEWIKVIKQVDLLDQALEPGARVRRTGTLMGYEFSWTTEVESVHFPHLLILKVTDGPFSGIIRYDVQRSGAGSRVRVRNVGQSDELPVPASMLAGPLKSAMQSDLERLKALVEG
ncbi:MAG: SRPBCC family protein [Acidobacteria bacterium]|nr:SRPBCC family protein [Acidobacteriota bacterium]